MLIFSGEFANDRLSGQGEMQYADGSVYNGQWIDNQVRVIYHSYTLHYTTKKDIAIVIKVNGRKMQLERFKP